MITIGLVANEPSGDQLGAAVARALRERLPELRIVGVAGPRMLAEGCESLIDMERLSVMGLTEVLKHLPELLRLRRRLVAELADLKPDLVLGVDAPDFNLGLESQLRAQGVRTAHLVSPTVWAWRPGRVKGMREAVDLLLCVFPFEEDFLRKHGVPARYVGHPLADEVPLGIDQAAARRALGVQGTGPVLAILPGSRMSEVESLAEPFIETARWLQGRRPELRFIVPLVNARVRATFEVKLRRLAPGVPMQLVDGQARRVLAAADMALTASGTATLECLLHKRPMVVAYRVHPLTYHLVRIFGMVQVRYVAMANILADEELAPELLQHRCRPELLGPAVLELLTDRERRALIQARYEEIHQGLRHDAAARAADALVELLQAKPGTSM